MDLLLHPSDDAGVHRPARGGRLSTVGHGEAFRAFAGAAKGAGVRFMVIGGTFRDVAVRAASTRDIDVVLVDADELDPKIMADAGFTRAPRSRHAWRYRADSGPVDVEIAALASSKDPAGPFSVAYRHAESRVIEGARVPVPRVEDYVILKLLAAAGDRHRRARDLADVQFAIEAYSDRARTSLSVAGVRARLRDLYGIKGRRLNDLVALLRQIPRPRRA